MSYWLIIITNSNKKKIKKINIEVTNSGITSLTSSMDFEICSARFHLLTRISHKFNLKKERKKKLFLKRDKKKKKYEERKKEWLDSYKVNWLSDYGSIAIPSLVIFKLSFMQKMIKYTWTSSDRFMSKIDIIFRR